METRRALSYVTAGVLAATLAGAGAPALAATESSTKSETATPQGAAKLDDSLISKADKHVQVKDGMFVVSPEAANSLTSEELDAVNDSVESTNRKITETENEGFTTTQSGKTITLSSAPQSSDGTQLRAASQDGGVTKFETKWWGTKIFLSNKDAIALLGGASIAGIWVPEAIVSKGLATLGVAGTTALSRDGRGIQFDVPLTGAPNIYSFRWQ